MPGLWVCLALAACACTHDFDEFEVATGAEPDAEPDATAVHQPRSEAGSSQAAPLPAAGDATPDAATDRRAIDAGGPADARDSGGRSPSCDQLASSCGGEHTQCLADCGSVERECVAACDKKKCERDCEGAAELCRAGCGDRCVACFMSGGCVAVCPT